MRATHKCKCTKENLEQIRHFVSDHLEGQIDSIIGEQIVLAIDEACANAIIHGNKSDPDKEIQVIISIENKQLEVEISDIGNNEISYTEADATDIQQLVAERRKGGLGLMLMHTIMDQIIFSNEDGRNICRLSKSLN